MSFKNLEDTKLFGTSGIRGVVGKDLNYELLWNLGRAIATSLDPSSKVLIATDSRESYPYRGRPADQYVRNPVDCEKTQG